MGLCLWTFRNENGVIPALCLVNVMLASSSSTFGKRVIDDINILCESGTWEARVFAQFGARITQAYDKHTNTRGGFEISSTEYGK